MSEATRAQGVVRIGDWLVEPSLNRLSRGDVSVQLEPLAIAVLGYLARHAGRVVSADELTAELWDRRFVGDSPVYRVIAELRRELGDDARHPRYIETIRKRGYRLVADAEWLSDDTNETAGEARTDAVTREAAGVRDEMATAQTAWPVTRTSRLGWSALALVAVILVGGGTLLLREDTRDTAPASGGTTRAAPIIIAVLPFENLTPGNEDYFVRGLTGAVTTRLAGLSGLGVISQHSARQYHRPDRSTRRIGEELGAQYLVTGSAQWRTADQAHDQDSHVDRLRVSAHLVDVTSDTYLWSQTFDQPLRDLFDVQIGIAEQVAQQLDLTLLEPERATLRARSTDDFEAYRSYLRGKDAFDRGWREQNISEAVTAFEQAIERDPEFALAYAGLGSAHLQLYAQYFDRTDERLEKAKTHIDRGLAIDPELAEGRLGLGEYYLRRNMLSAALGPLERALRRQPSNTRALSAIAQVHQRRGELDLAVHSLETATKLDPRNHRLLYMLGQTQLVNGQYAKAEQALERAITLQPDLLEGYLFKAVLYMAWRGEEALAEAEMLRAADRLGLDAVIELLLQPGLSGAFRFAGETFRERLDAWQIDGSSVDPAAYHLAKAERAELQDDLPAARHHYEAARKLLEETVRQIPGEPLFHALLGTAYAGSGMPEEAIAAGRAALQLAPVDENPWDNADYLWYMAEIYVLAGRYDAAIKQVEQALQYPTTLSPTWMRVEPFWEPLRDHPRFRQLLGMP